jgi:hypothetical protein
MTRRIPGVRNGTLHERYLPEITTIWIRDGRGSAGQLRNYEDFVQPVPAYAGSRLRPRRDPHEEEACYDPTGAY